MTSDERMTDDEWENENPLVVREDDVAVPPAYDLEERCAKFGERVIDFCKAMPRGPLTDRIIDQLIGAGTSVGANYCEADDAVSKKEFIVKIGTCRKEARETKFHLRMAACAVPELKDRARTVWLEAKALHLIFSKIYRTSRK